MKTIEKRDYIHSHLHQIDDNLIDKMYKQMLSIIDETDSIVGYNAIGIPIKKSQFIADIKEAEDQFKNGEYTTLDELEEESKKW